MAEIGASSYRRFPRLDENALDQVLITYSDGLVRFVYSILHDAATAEDIAAESIAVLLTKHKRFRDDGHLRAYLYTVARNKAMDHLRHHRRFVALEDLENVLGSGDPEADFLQSERNTIIYRCMQQLPEQYRQVLQLAYFDNFGVQEIAGITRQSTKQVYNLLARAKTSLKIRLMKEGITYEDI